MPRISLTFIGTGAFCGLIGMIWGMIMAANPDLRYMHPAHAHLNLLGWVTLSIMGLFYSHPRAVSGRVAWANFLLVALGTIILIPPLAILLGDEANLGPKLGPLLTAPEAMIVAGMMCFLFNVWRTARAPKA